MEESKNSDFKKSETINEHSIQGEVIHNIDRYGASRDKCDYDKLIGYWIKDVPYILTGNHSFNTVIRKYIVSIGIYTKYHHPSDGLSYLVDSSNECKRFFMLTQNELQIFVKGSVRINGYDVISESMNIYTSEVYSILQLTNSGVRSKISKFLTDPLKNVIPDPRFGPKQTSKIYSQMSEEYSFDLLTSSDYSAWTTFYTILKLFDLITKDVMIYHPLHKIENSKFFQMRHAFSVQFVFKMNKINEVFADWNSLLTQLSATKRYFIIDISLNVVISETDGFGHANLIIIDKVQKNIYCYEPHGCFVNNDIPTSDKNLHNEMILSILRKLPVKYRYYGVIYLENIIPGFQVMELRSNILQPDGGEYGYCAFWCTVLIYFIMTFQKYKLSVIFKKFIDSVVQYPGSIHEYIYRIAEGQRKIVMSYGCKDLSTDCSKIVADHYNNVFLPKNIKLLSKR